MNRMIEKSVKGALVRARNAIEDLGMKDSLVKSKQWEINFTDQGNNSGQETQDIDKEDIDEEDIDEVGLEVDDTSTHDVLQSKESCTDLLLLEKQDVIDIDEIVKKRLIAIHSDDKADGTSTLPMYKHLGDDDVTKGKRLMNNSRKFIEVKHKGETIFLRKTTIAWLFQEGERVCSDRLFRVRAKQPYSSYNQQISSKCETSKIPVVHEMAVFVPLLSKDGA